MMRKVQNSGTTPGTVSAAALAIGGLVGLARIGDVALEQQRVAEIVRMRVEVDARLGVLAVGLQPLERVIGDQAALDPRLRPRHEIVDARHRRIERARRDQCRAPRES